MWVALYGGGAVHHYRTDGTRDDQLHTGDLDVLLTFFDFPIADHILPVVVVTAAP